SISLGDREDAATNVCRGPAWRLRPAARFLDPAHRHNVLRAISPDAAKTCSGGAGEAYRSYSLTRYPASLEIARFSISASGLGCAKTPALAPHVEISLSRESNHTVHARLDALLENCVFYISRMYEFLHSQGQERTSPLCLPMSALPPKANICDSADRPKLT